MLEQMDENLFQKWQQFEDEEHFGTVALHRMLARIAAASCGFKMQENEFLLRS